GNFAIVIDLHIANKRMFKHMNFGQCIKFFSNSLKISRKCTMKASRQAANISRQGAKKTQSREGSLYFHATLR
ncbi:MAG TPA: hypothetical protein VK628_10490, partial [Flavitalea sp.]|nr:hypothetical protein [Flavitalea sp.]